MDAQKVGNRLLDNGLVLKLMNYFNSNSNADESNKFKAVCDEINEMKQMNIQASVIYFFVPSCIMMHSNPLVILDKIKKVIEVIFQEDSIALNSTLLFQQTAILATRGVSKLYEIGVLNPDKSQ